MEAKKWYQSLGLWGAKAVIILSVLPLVVQWLDASFGLHLSTNPTVVSILTGAAGLVAWYGRFTAKTTIDKSV